MAKVHEIRASLLRHVGDLSATHHSRIIDGLIADNLVDGDGGQVHAAASKRVPLGVMTLRAAAEKAVADQDPRRADLIRNITGRARRLGYDIDPDQIINTFELDRAIRASTTEDRIALKSDLHRIGLIPA